VTFSFFLFVYKVSREPLNGSAPNSQGRLVWSIAWTSLNVKVKGQGHQRQKNGKLLSHPIDSALVHRKPRAADGTIESQPGRDGSAR